MTETKAIIIGLIVFTIAAISWSKLSIEFSFIGYFMIAGFLLYVLKLIIQEKL